MSSSAVLSPNSFRTTCKLRPLTIASATCSSRCSITVSVMLEPPAHARNHSVEHTSDPAFGNRELRNGPSPMVTTPTRRLRWDRPQQSSWSAELLAQPARTVYPPSAHVPAPIVQGGALPTCKPLVSHVEVPDLPRAIRAQKVPLSVATKVASIAHHIDHLLRAVDDHGDRLARGDREGRGGYPPDVIDADARGGVDEGARFTGSAFAEGGEGHVEILSTLNRVCGWKGRGRRKARA